MLACVTGSFELKIMCINSLFRKRKFVINVTNMNNKRPVRFLKPDRSENTDQLLTNKIKIV